MTNRDKEKSAPETKMDKNDKGDSKSVLQSVFSATSLIAIIFAALLYFWGWRYISSYYAAFGVDPIFFSFSPTDIIFSGWRVYVAVLCLVAVGTFLLTLFQKNIDGKITIRNLNTTVALFWLALAVSCGLAAFELYKYLFVFGAHSTYQFFVWAFIMLFFFYVTFLTGYAIFKSQSIPKARSSLLIRSFEWIFPASEIWVLFLVLIFIFTLSAFSSWEGLAFSKRDQGNGSRLQIATIYLNKPLVITGIQPTQSGTWMADDLRILFKTEDMYFFFRTEEVEQNDGVPIIYSIPKAAVEEIILRSWYDKFAHAVTPIPAITATPTATSIP
jgi:hypothetical protein